MSNSPNSLQTSFVRSVIQTQRPIGTDVRHTARTLFKQALLGQLQTQWPIGTGVCHIVLTLFKQAFVRRSVTDTTTHMDWHMSHSPISLQTSFVRSVTDTMTDRDWRMSHSPNSLQTSFVRSVTDNDRYGLVYVTQPELSPNKLLLGQLQTMRGR